MKRRGLLLILLAATWVRAEEPATDVETQRLQLQVERARLEADRARFEAEKARWEAERDAARPANATPTQDPPRPVTRYLALRDVRLYQGQRLMQELRAGSVVAAVPHEKDGWLKVQAQGSTYDADASAFLAEKPALLRAQGDADRKAARRAELDRERSDLAARRRHLEDQRVSLEGRRDTVVVVQPQPAGTNQPGPGFVVMSDPANLTLAGQIRRDLREVEKALERVERDRDAALAAEQKAQAALARIRAQFAGAAAAEF